MNCKIKEMMNILLNLKTDLTNEESYNLAKLSIKSIKFLNIPLTTNEMKRYATKII